MITSWPGPLRPGIKECEAGFSLHAGVAARGSQRGKLACICRYIARPAVSGKRLSLTANGQVRYQLKTPYRDGTTKVIFNPLDFLADTAHRRLAALVLRGPTKTASQPDAVSRRIRPARPDPIKPGKRR